MKARAMGEAIVDKSRQKHSFIGYLDDAETKLLP